jgi:hypothetical protein
MCFLYRSTQEVMQQFVRHNPRGLRPPAFEVNGVGRNPFCHDAETALISVEQEPLHIFVVAAGLRCYARAMLRVLPHRPGGFAGVELLCPLSIQRGTKEKSRHEGD